MTAKVLLAQAKALNRVSARLESVAGKHSFLTEALMMLSGTIRTCAAFLEVLVATRLKPKPARE